ncbi:xanthine dehydrogenase subunit D [Pullulanibacillus sp. KACC 23026]|uniref:xanthine dehydrogenase subunit D n=1 Tax=Pullulanibacillus sp. KACC 23026 TaxID=3028315 RepID=UPI0023B18955|nr:xanthine dehydrogenase subunit D [Pullulanibacillus sp. KACC 23026]WEG14808.1 xanthine dehydrogenase subunit D [Pullulanibacillus sp. KACC 23026]
MLANRKDKGRIRPDGQDKVTGCLAYLTDLTFERMLHGKVLRSTYPHAEIKAIHTKKAEQLPGVVAVITHKDIPGLNGFGLITPDQPVLCDFVVRSIGDAVAAVAAETEEIARQALDLIVVDYDPLPVVDNPHTALFPNAPKLHSNGNLLHKASFIKGDVKKGFGDCTCIVEETYEVPRQMHAYMETEGGVVVPEDDGGITVYMGTQHGYKDRYQLSRILNCSEALIRVVSSPMGGSFGGKDELNVQPYAALLALKTGRPVRIHQTREESLRSGIKRHPMTITMKTGTDASGKLLAHQVRIVADTGAYASLGPAVLDFAVEHATGPYRIAHVETEGLSIFTNNGVAGEFRGFGGNQVTFALEGQMDRLAEKLGIAPIELRRRNLRNATDLGPMEHRIAPTDGASMVVEALDHQYTKRLAARDSDVFNPFIKRGIGIAITMHGGGLGYGRLDSSGGRLALNNDGRIEVSFGFEECGQGLLAVIETIVTSELHCAPSDLLILNGDTHLVPPTGSSTASRATSMVWTAIQRLKEAFTNKLLHAASLYLGLMETDLKLGEGGIWRRSDRKSETPLMSYKELAEYANHEEPICVDTHFEFPTTPDPVPGGHFLYSFAGVLAEVEVDLLTGRVKVRRLDQTVAAGPVVSPLGYLGQIEGGAVMALGYSLTEEAKMVGGHYVTKNFDTYLIPTIRDAPLEMNVDAIEMLDEGDSYGPRGVGEIGTVAVAPAITKAIHDAIGYWPVKLPVCPEALLSHVEEGLFPWTLKKQA